jgi:hypothetical protein
MAAPPGEVRDAAGRLNLPYSQRVIGYSEGGDPWHTGYHASGRVSKESIPFARHHRKGRQPMVVAHYPRLDKLAEDRALDAVPDAAAAYTAGRVCQEVRFRPEAIRRVIRGGPATPGVVLGSFPALVRAARLKPRPSVEAGILRFPATDPEGVAALKEVAWVLG